VSIVLRGWHQGGGVQLAGPAQQGRTFWPGGDGAPAGTFSAAHADKVIGFAVVYLAAGEARVDKLTAYAVVEPS